MERIFIFEDLPEEAVNLLLEMCPKLKRISMMKTFDDTMKRISANCRSLERLSIDTVRNPPESYNKFLHLKFLKVSFITNITYWTSLIEATPSIETLGVKWAKAYQITQKEFLPLLRKPLLSHLVLRFCFAKTCWLYGIEETLVLANVEFNGEHGSLKTLQLCVAQKEDRDMILADLEDTN